MKQRLTEWLDTPKTDYHERQVLGIYRSTIHFCDWLAKVGYIDSDSVQNILDLGCGLGGNIVYMARRYPKCRFVGVDINTDWVSRGNTLLKKEGIRNAHIEYGDWYNLDYETLSVFTGVISFQTLSWLPDFKEPLEKIAELGPRWIAMTSLFYEGLVSCVTETQTYDDNFKKVRNLYYNVYSLPVVGNFLKGLDYTDFKYEKFDIDIDIPNTGEFKTYTERLEDGRRVQISGPVFMPWYFIAAQRRMN